MALSKDKAMKIHEQIDQFDQWVDMWAKANDDGIFEKTPDIVPNQTADVSFFGPTDTHSTPTLRDADVKYWSDIYDMSKYNDGSGEDPTMLTEQDDKKVTDSVKAMAQSPNPIRAGSVGMDQAMDNKSLGVTFTPQDIESLAEMKVKLHGLKDKLNTMESKGQSGGKLESQINGLQEKIDELSDSLGRAFPGAVLPQGD